jgi:protein-S-isoprenylcysteine O-methyltransferase Ste14
MTPLQWVALLWAGSEVVIGLTHIAPRRSRKQDRFSGPVLVAFLFIAVWVGALLGRRLPGAAMTTGRDLAYWLGIALALAGIAVRWYAVITLGRSFTTRVMTRPDQTVVRSGPYRFVRHPSYTGLLMTALGLVLCSTNWLALACFPLALLGFAYRIKVEEQALLDGLGAPYRDYMRHTKRLVPFVV